MTTIQRNYPSTTTQGRTTSARAMRVQSVQASVYSVVSNNNTLFNNKRSASSAYAVGGGFVSGTTANLGSRRTSSASVADNGFSNDLFGELTVRPVAQPQLRGIPGAGTGVLLPLSDAVGFLLCLALVYLLIRRKRVQRQSL